jgi:hypothetical protein
VYTLHGEPGDSLPEKRAIDPENIHGLPITTLFSRFFFRCTLSITSEICFERVVALPEFRGTPFSCSYRLIPDTGISSSVYYVCAPEENISLFIEGYLIRASEGELSSLGTPVPLKYPYY